MHQHQAKAPRGGGSAGGGISAAAAQLGPTRRIGGEKTSWVERCEHGVESEHCEGSQGELATLEIAGACAVGTCPVEIL